MKDNINEECRKCDKEVCPDECFNRHPGSAHAIIKIAKKLKIGVFLVGFTDW